MSDNVPDLYSFPSSTYRPSLPATGHDREAPRRGYTRRLKADELDRAQAAQRIESTRAVYNGPPSPDAIGRRWEHGGGQHDAIVKRGGTRHRQAKNFLVGRGLLPADDVEDSAASTVSQSTTAPTLPPAASRVGRKRSAETQESDSQESERTAPSLRGQAGPRTGDDSQDDEAANNASDASEDEHEDEQNLSFDDDLILPDGSQQDEVPRQRDRDAPPSLLGDEVLRRLLSAIRADPGLGSDLAGRLEAWLNSLDLNAAVSGELQRDLDRTLDAFKTRESTESGRARADLVT